MCVICIYGTALITITNQTIKPDTWRAATKGEEKSSLRSAKQQQQHLGSQIRKQYYSIQTHVLCVCVHVLRCLRQHQLHVNNAWTLTLWRIFVCTTLGYTTSGASSAPPLSAPAQRHATRQPHVWLASHPRPTNQPTTTFLPHNHRRQTTTNDQPNLHPRCKLPTPAVHPTITHGYLSDLSSRTRRTTPILPST